jgi:hypothetical protein
MTAGPARPLKVGILLPQLEGMMAGASARWPDILAIAEVTRGGWPGFSVGGRSSPVLTAPGGASTGGRL